MCIRDRYLIDDGNDPESEHDFGKNIIPRMLEDGRKMYAYSFDGYWRDVGTIDSLWEANMELLDENPQIDLNDDKMRIYTRNFSLPPHYIAPGSSVKNSILADGCVIEGEVENCVIHSGEMCIRDSLETLIVLDGTTGQNAMAQAKQFKEETDISGIILTKLDGTAKGCILYTSCEPTLAGCARDINLGKYVLLSKGEDMTG